MPSILAIVDLKDFASAAPRLNANNAHGSRINRWHRRLLSMGRQTGEANCADVLI
jgi:hypothetical protein